VSYIPTKAAEPIYNIYGFGQPDLASAVDSNSNDVLLFAENTIKIQGVHYYYFYLPDTFINVPGKREISVTLVYVYAHSFLPRVYKERLIRFCPP